MNAKTTHILLSLALGLLALTGTLALLWTMGSQTYIARARPAGHPAPSPAIAATAAVTRYVSSVTGVDTGDCTADNAPCQTIQYAVDQANDGDEIHIATRDNTDPASYTGTGENVIVLTKSLTLRGGYFYAHTDLVHTWTRGLLPSTVDGEGARRALYVSGDISPTLRMLSFVNGHAERGGNVYAEDASLRFIATPVMSGTATYGGGLYLKNCRTSFDPGELAFNPGSGMLEQLGVSGLLLIRNNAAQYGGGIYIEGGMPILAGLAVRSNTATADGGGIYLEGGGPVFAGGIVWENQAGNRGGGLYLSDSAARIAGTAVYSNTAADGAGFYLDGPLAFSELTVPIIANNYIRYNRTTGSQGGGFYLRKAIAGLVNNVIADNQADDGAAMYLWASSPQLFHNTIAQNAGNSGVYVTHQPGQAWPPVAPIPSYPSFTNTIVVSQVLGIYVDSTGIPAPLENQVTLDGTLWQGNGNDTGGSGQIVRSNDVSGDPRFKCTGGLPGCVLPYHLEEDSAAVDAGVVPALSIPGTDLFVDIDGQLRPSNQAYDIGADEVVTRSFDVWFMPPVSTLGAAPGQTVTHTHQLMNTGLQTDTYDLGFHSGNGWATLLSDSVITLGTQASATVQVRVTVPETATDRMRDTSTITATSRGSLDRKGHALDVTRVVTGDVTDLSVGKWADVEDTVEPGEAIRFTIVVTNEGPLTDTLVVTLTDTAVPTRALAAWSLPSGCSGVITSGTAVCTRTLPGGSVPVSGSLMLVITTSETYTGLLVNMVSVNAADVADSDLNNNVAQASVGVTVPVTTCTPLESVTISGPTQGYSGAAIAFTASISPSEATPPIVYVWQPQPDGSTVLPGQSVATYTWSTTGTKTITVTATNCGGGSDGDTYTITIHEGERIYLPLVLKNA